MENIGYYAAIISALIAAIAAIVAPLITAKINSKTQLKITQMNIEYKYKLKLITEFTQNFENMGNLSNYFEAAKAQSAAANLATVCNNAETKEALLSLSDYLTKNPCRDETSCKLFNKCINLLATKDSEELPTTQ